MSPVLTLQSKDYFIMEYSVQFLIVVLFFTLGTLGLSDLTGWDHSACAIGSVLFIQRQK